MPRLDAAGVPDLDREICLAYARVDRRADGPAWRVYGTVGGHTNRLVDFYRDLRRSASGDSAIHQRLAAQFDELAAKSTRSQRDAAQASDAVPVGSHAPELVFGCSVR